MTVSFPVALKLAGRPCLVVGNGEETERRVRALLAAGAHVKLVTLGPAPALAALAAAPALVVEQRDYRSNDLTGMWLAVFCDRNQELALRIGRDAERCQTFFCAIDEPAPSSFSHLGLARTGPLFVAVGTEGKAPALARRLKDELQRLLEDPTLCAFVDHIIELRAHTPAAERARRLGREARRLHLEASFRLDQNQDRD